MSGAGSEIEFEETVDVVERRVEFLRALRADPKYKPELQEQFDVSRSTVYKAIRELEESALVRRSEEGYELTLTGRLLLAEYEEFHATVENICSLGRLLALLPSEVDLPTSLLVGARTVVIEQHAPNQPVSAFEEMVRGATVLKGTSSIVLPHLVRIVHRKAVAGELDVELILERPVIDHLSTEYSDELGEAVASGNVSIRETEHSLDYGLVLVEAPTEEIGIVIYGPNGEPKGFIANDSEPALDWARGVWDRHQRETTPL